MATKNDPNTQGYTPDTVSLDWREESARLEYEERKERKALADEQKMSHAAARKQGHDAIIRQMEMKAAEQAQCSHMKPMNAGPATAGQKDHKGVYHWLCQYCHKEWTGAELPLTLRIDHNLVGGPL